MTLIWVSQCEIRVAFCTQFVLKRCNEAGMEALMHASHGLLSGGGHQLFSRAPLTMNEYGLFGGSTREKNPLVNVLIDCAARTMRLPSGGASSDLT